MIEEVVNTNNKTKVKAARPRPLYLWTISDVQKWFRRHCSDYYQLYHELFLNHEITGKTLLRMNDTKLLRMGITNTEHRNEICREVLKLSLKTDILEIRDIERRNDINYDH